MASLFFYGYWNWSYLLLLLGSVSLNYLIGNYLQAQQGERDKTVLIAGVVFNIGLLAFFKYFNFFLENLNIAFALNLSTWDILLPLAISFFTFQQIAYLVDSWTGKAKNYDFQSYLLFVSFFPQLVAGPIVHHSQIMPQFRLLGGNTPNWKNILTGAHIFFIGLFKKVVIADTCATWADRGFANASSLDFLSSWVTALSYTFQLYYDFSGYTDMAIGAALLLNITLPINFNSPYKALSIRDFWSRWHITLSSFLRDYVYIPMGGNRTGRLRTYTNLFLTFIIGGIWHGAGWTYLIWGGLHGLGIVVHRLWSGLYAPSGRELPKAIAWLITFVFVVVCWVFFRADSLHDAFDILSGMMGIQGFILPSFMAKKMAFLSEFGIQFGGIFKYIAPVRNDIILMSVVLLALLVISVVCKNSTQFKETFKPTRTYAIISAATMVVSLLFTNNPSVFLYFQF